MSWKASVQLATGDASDWLKVIFELLVNEFGISHLLVKDVRGIPGTFEFFLCSCYTKSWHREPQHGFITKTSSTTSPALWKDTTGTPELGTAMQSPVNTTRINTISNQRCQDERASCWKGGAQQSRGTAVAGLMIPIKTETKPKDQASR